MSEKKLLILCQVGSPSAPTPEAVGIYLKKFLMDEKVITLPKIFRWILVNLLIVPKRKFASAEKYHKIWTPKGAPLKIETESFAQCLRQELGAQYDVALIFAYVSPTPEEILKKFSQQKYSEILVAPLFPQYAEATTGSVLSELTPLAEKLFPQTKIKSLKPFFSEKEWISAWTSKVTPEQQKTHILFSYHGLPEIQIRKVSGCELNNTCCARPETSKCYLAQCQKSTQEIAKALKLNNYSMSFQSRLGRAKWLGPATEVEAQRLAKEGVKDLTVICPAFVADGLETLEEIAIELRDKFLEAGGEKFELIESLNDDSAWVSGFAQVLRRASSWQDVDFKSV